MSVVVLLVALLTVVALAAAAALVVVAALGDRRPQDPRTARVLAAARRHERLVSVVAAAVTVAALATLPLVLPRLTTSTTTPGVLVGVAPVAGGLLHLALRAAGELTWPRPRGSVRNAPLARRTARALGGARLTALVTTTVLGTAAVVTWGLTAADDGRSVARTPFVDDLGGVVTGASGPYPGWPYGAPLLVTLALLLVATLGVLRLVARRPPVADLPAADDDALRRTSAARVLGGSQLCGAAGLAGYALVAAVSLRSAEHGAAAAVCALLGAGLLVGSLGAAVGAVLPARSRAPITTPPAGPPAPGTAGAMPSGMGVRP